MFNLEKIGRSTDQLLTETICRRPTTPLKKKERPHNDKISSFGLMFSNLEALASAEGGYDQKIWERFYRPDGTGYNCAQPGNETCTGR